MAAHRHADGEKETIPELDARDKKTRTREGGATVSFMFWNV